MRRVFHSAVLAAAAAVGITMVGAAQQVANTNRQVTLVMQNGERHTGTLVYHNDANLNLIENGQDKTYAQDTVAVVDFGTGDPSASELNQLPSGTGSRDRDRHMITLRDGSVVHGRMYTITPTAITINTAGGHQDIDLNNVARWYVNPQEARRVFANVLGHTTTQAVATAGQALPPGAISVEAGRGWTDTGIDVRKGQRIAFSTTGQIAIRQGDNPAIGPDGSSEKDPNAPVPGAGVGALVARVGTGAAFPIGSNSRPITMPANGRLFLGVNDAGVADNSGAFVVTISR